MITTIMFFVLVPFLKRAPRIIIHLATNVEKGGGVLMRITLPNLKHSFICPVPVPDSGFPGFLYARTGVFTPSSLTVRPADILAFISKI